MFQEAKSKWIVLRDLNTRFVHMAAVQRRRMNEVAALQNEEDTYIYEDQTLKDLLANFIRSYTLL